MGGKAPYGFHTEPIKIDGINTKKLVENPEEAEQVKLMFEMYAEPGTSYGDIVRHFAEHGIKAVSYTHLDVYKRQPCIQSGYRKVL